MVQFYETYTSSEYQVISERLRLYEFVRLPTAQVEDDVIVHSANAQLENNIIKQDLAATSEIVHSLNAQFNDCDIKCAAFPLFLSLVSFTSHIQILNRSHTMEEKIFYILYAARERLNYRELVRAFEMQTYDTVMSKEKEMSNVLKSTYPRAEFLLKDKVFVDFLRLPQKHNEPLLHAGILEHMKEFILAMGKDFLYMGNEYHIQIGGHQRRLDLLFYHRALQCLVDVELKSEGFQSEYVGKMDLYLEALDREIRRENENPSIGIILCPEADHYDVEYTLNRTMSPIMIAEYKRLLIPEEVMKKSLEDYCEFMKQEEGK